MATLSTALPQDLTTGKRTILVEVLGSSKDTNVFQDAKLCKMQSTASVLI